MPKDLPLICLYKVTPNYLLNMTKISFDVDFNQDPQKILQEIKKREEAEVAKREAKDKEKNYLSRLHEVVNKEIGTDLKILMH